jgi:putative ABC transport system permease protein
MLVPISAYPVVKQRSWNWFWLQVSTYVKLKNTVALDKTSLANLEGKFPALVKKHAFTRSNITYDEFIRKGGKLDFHLQPFTSVHLYSAAMGTASRLTTLGNIKYVYLFSIIAFFIIALACVNFMNLSTAQSAQRAREVGIRKVLGSLKGSLIKQFLAESLLLSFMSVLIALAGVLVLLRPFNLMTGKTLDMGLLVSGYNWIIILGLTVMTGLLAGSYPAFYLTSFNPVAVLKDLKWSGSELGALFIRNGMVVFQFSVSTALIICTIIIYEQLRYTQTRDLGLNKENVLFIANANRLGNSVDAFREELINMPEVLGASVSSSIPSRGNFGDVYVPEASYEGEQLTKELGLSSFIVDDDFIPTLQIEVLEGRNFSKEFMDSASVILNETAVKQAGWTEPVGKFLQYPGNRQRFKVIGVAKDFNIESLQNLVAPFALFHSTSKTYNLGNAYVLIRLKPEGLHDQVKKVETTWKTFAPNTPFDYGFLDGEFEALYRSEQRMGRIFSLFTFLSIFVACLGLFGLAAYTAERRTKEIGIRKVLGASVQNIVTMLSKDFIRLVLIATIVAFPLAWWSMNNWLKTFAYRVDMSWWMFALAGAMAIFIALLTVSFQALRASVANPVRSLRME